MVSIKPRDIRPALTFHFRICRLKLWKPRDNKFECSHFWKVLSNRFWRFPNKLGMKWATQIQKGGKKQVRNRTNLLNKRKSPQPKTGIHAFGSNLDKTAKNDRIWSDGIFYLTLYLSPAIKVRQPRFSNGNFRFGGLISRAYELCLVIDPQENLPLSSEPNTGSRASK